MATILRNAYRLSRDKGLEHLRALAAVAGYYSVTIHEVLNAVRGE